MVSAVSSLASAPGEVLLPSPEHCKVARVCLSLLAQKGSLHLTGDRFSLPLREFFQLHPVDNPPLLERLSPVLEFSAEQMYTSHNEEMLLFLKTQLQGISSSKTFEQAFFTKCFYTALVNPSSHIVIIWHRVFQKIPVEAQEWKEFSSLQKLYSYLPVLKDVKVGQLLEGIPSEEEPLSVDQLEQAWQVWVSHLKGHLVVESEVYQNMEELALEGTPALKTRLQHQHSSIVRKVNKTRLRNLFWDDPLMFLTKHERLIAAEKKVSSVSSQVHLFRKDPLFLQAVIFDYLNPVKGIFATLYPLAKRMEETFKEHKKTLNRCIFPDKSIELQGSANRISWMHQTAVNEWQQIFVNSSVVFLLSDYLCSYLQKSLGPWLQESTEGKSLERVQASLHQKLSYHALVLDDFIEEEPVVKQVTSPKAKREVIARPSVKPLEVASSLPQEPEVVTDPFEEQIKADLIVLQEREIFGALTPFAATLREYLHMHFPKELGDHFFLMTQGLELLCDATLKKKGENLACILRSFLIDFHVILEQYFVSLIKNVELQDPKSHNLRELAEISKVALSQEQKAFLERTHLVLYWARYPACSKRYFGDPKNQPPFLRALLSLSCGLKAEVLEEVITAYHFVLEQIVPVDLRPLKLMEKVRSLTGLKANKCSSSGSFSSSVSSQIQKILEESRESDLTVHLEELIYYLSWIQQGQHLKKEYQDPSLAFWHERNALEVDKLFKHLYATDCLLHDKGEIRAHQIASFFEPLEEVRALDRATKSFLRSFNMGISLHYHTKSSPLQQPLQDLLKESCARVHGFSHAQKEMKPLFPHFEKALAFFHSQLPPTLEALKRLT